MGYRERRLARAERLRDWADGRRQKSERAFGAVRRLADAIPFGQPILVGHHSERHARRDQERIHNGMRAGCDHADKPASMSSRAAEIERQAEHAIYSDDADAIERLQARIAELEADRERMKTANAAYRKAHGAELRAMAGAYERSQAMPHASYELQNLAGNLTRQRQRLAQLQAERVERPATERPVVDGDTATARAGLTVVASMTTPSRPGKKPRPVWNVSGRLDFWQPLLRELGASVWHGVFSFWDDPTEALEAALLERETAAPAAPPAADQVAG